MRNLKKAPTLFTFNTLGVAMFGRREPDVATGTYIKTRYITALFLPLFPLDSFRVADAPGGGWYFLGKESIDGRARGWRWCVAILAIIFAGAYKWSEHTASPAYRAGKAREQGSELAAAGKPMEAVKIYLDVMEEGIGDQAEWRQASATLLAAEISFADPARAAAAVAYADKHKRIPRSQDTLVPDLADQALAAAAKCSDPAAAERILSSFTPAPTDLARVHEALRKHLESLHAARPDDHETRVKLALIREEFGEVDGAIALLEPTANQLGSGEGARLFGNLLLGEGRAAEALPHLERYVTPRLERWKQAEANLDATYKAAQQNILNFLNNTGGPAGFKDRYEAADEEEQQRMVNDYLNQEAQKDTMFLSARDNYEKAGNLVPSIMSLGVTRLRLAQASSDTEQRKTLLKAAEETFLSLKSVAGESDEFRLFLGQIYYWSSREPEGLTLFNELLTSNQRNFASLYQIANIYRDLGEDNESRKLLEEAYPKATNDNDKVLVITLRSLLARDTDEKILWLSKINVSADRQLAISLSEARGAKAEETSDPTTAARHYREALAGYEAQQRTSAALNNSALLYGSLYRLEGKQADFETSARLISEAVELEPADSILSSNAADFQLTAAVIRLVGDRINPKLIQFSSGIQSLRFLYQNAEEKKPLVAALKSDPNFRKAISHYWDALLLAPKSSRSYGWGAAVFQYIDDQESLAKILAKAEEQNFDFTAQKEDVALYLKKGRDEEIREALKTQREKVSALVASLNDSRSRAFAQMSVSSAWLGGFSIGEPIQPEKWLANLIAANKEAPCAGLQSALEGALTIIALEKLAAESPACAALIEANRRLLSGAEILILLVRAKGELGDLVRKHPAVIESREMSARSTAAFPLSIGLDEWLIIDGLDSAADVKLKERTAANEMDRLATRIDSELSYESASILLTDFWTKVFVGDTTAARELLPKIEAAGVKLPPLF